MKQVITTLCFSCFAALLFAQGPHISVQGTLKDANGVTVDDGLYELTFNLYEAAEGGTSVFMEVGEVRVKGGIYTYLLGSINTLNPSIFGKTLYLGITVNGTELTPKGEMTYAPYALAVNTAIYADTARFAQNLVGGDPCKGAIGDIKYSILPLTQFQSVNGDCWALMDGASLPVGNPLRNLTTVNTIPDARGVFLRSHDGRDEASSQDKDRTIAGLTDVGTFQQDGLVEHAHKKAYKDVIPEDYFGGYPHGFLSSSGTIKMTAINIVAATFSQDFHGKFTDTELETNDIRPKNLNFYLYIRIE